jgi:energy-coupling factor transporter ATP-binding protein EcfA2
MSETIGLGLVVAGAMTMAVLEASPASRFRLARLLARIAGLVAPGRRDEFSAELAYLQRDLGEDGLAYATGTWTAALTERAVTWWDRDAGTVLAPATGPLVTVPGGSIVGLIAGRASGRSTIASVVARPAPTAAPNGVEVADVQLRADESAHRCGDDLIPSLTVAENLLVVRRSGWRDLVVSPSRARALAATALEELGVTGIDLDRPVADLGRPDRALVALAAAVQGQASTIVFEDPSLSAAGRRRVVEVLEQIRRRGIGVVMISHDIGEICSVADRVTVLRNGEVAFEAPTEELTPDDIIHHLVGG